MCCPDSPKKGLFLYWVICFFLGAKVGGAPVTSDLTCHRSADIVFLVDTSTSIWSVHFNTHMKTFLKEVISTFHIGPGPLDTRVGVILFGTYHYVEFDLSKYKNVADTLKAVERMTYRRGNTQTNTHAALEYVAENMFNSSHGFRPNSFKTVIAITDGVSRYGRKTTDAAKFLKNQGVTIFAIGVGNNTNNIELREMASSPSYLFFFQVKDFKSLTNVEKRLTRLECTDRVMSLTSKALFTLVCFPFVLAGVSSQVLINDSQAIQDFLLDYNTRAGLIAYDLTEATWNFNTNLTDYNQNITLDKQLKWDQFLQEAASNATGYDTSVMSEADKRQFHIIKDIGISAQTNETKLKRLNKILSDMESIYSTAKVCLNSTNCVPLDPGYTDTGAYWRSKYETPTFEEDVLGLYNQLRPLYEQLHAYVRRKLKAIYGSDNFPASGHIPAHILGNMWAQEWDNLIKELSPYPKKPTFDVTDEMIRQNYTALKIFQTADSFFQSLGLIPMPPEFWNKSVFERPADGREIVCHASAWDFNNGKDFRINQCTVVNSKDFNTAHHEMGHIEYFLQYANQPIAFRDGANPGFHEAVGDTISLSVNTPEHMYAIGLLKESIEDKKSDINYLMSMALEKIAFLPFGYLIDQWRWKVFRGDITPDKYNEEWWNLRCHYQGIFPPVARSSDDFDPGAKYHIPANYPYISYFVSFVIQFQFHKALCDEAGYKGPLHRCDIYNNTKAGKKLSDILQLGRSQPWPVAMKILTGQTKTDAQPLMDYFKPLINFLKKENGEDIGWQPNCPSY